MDNYREVKNKLSTVSPCFCLAKWTTVTLHLESGTNHSCHHPKVHETPLEELRDNPASLHNTRYKMEQRRSMIKGERPPECGYCWNIEDLESDVFSDRVLKSSESHSAVEFDKIVQDPFNFKLIPKYVEVSFSNTCQFKCSYCSANFSSSWAEEIQKYGPYHNGHGEGYLKIYKEDENPYIKAFWQWWPDLKKEMDTFRITGGEPVLSPNTFKVLDSLKEAPQPQLNVCINSNLGAPEVLINKFINSTVGLLQTNSVKSLCIYTSIDAYGERAEYIRNGLKHDYFWSNIEKLLSSSADIKIIIMCTFNALSITSFVPLLKKIMDINDKYTNANRPVALDIDIAYLRHPLHQIVTILPDEYIVQAEQILKFIEDNQKVRDSKNWGFGHMHIIKMKRIVDWMKKGLPADEKKHYQAEFYRFFTEHDKRRSRNFLQVFPEMENFWIECRSSAGN